MAKFLRSWRRRIFRKLWTAAPRLPQNSSGTILTLATLIGMCRAATLSQCSVEASTTDTLGLAHVRHRFTRPPILQGLQSFLQRFLGLSEGSCKLSNQISYVLGQAFELGLQDERHHRKSAHTTTGQYDMIEQRQLRIQIAGAEYSTQEKIGIV